MEIFVFNFCRSIEQHNFITTKTCKLWYIIKPVYYDHLGTNHKCPDYQCVHADQYNMIKLHHLGP